MVSNVVISHFRLCSMMGSMILCRYGFDPTLVRETPTLLHSKLQLLIFSLSKRLGSNTYLYLQFCAKVIFQGRCLKRVNFVCKRYVFDFHRQCDAVCCHGVLGSFKMARKPSRYVGYNKPSSGPSNSFFIR